MRKVLSVGLGCVLGMLASGCAFGTRHVSLLPAGAGAVQGSAENSGISLEVPKPQDCRVEANAVGCVRNGWGMRTAEVVADRSVPEWVQESVVAALKSSGFEVRKTDVDATDTARHSSDCVVTVLLSLDKVFCESLMQYSAEVGLGAEVLVRGKSVQRRNYKGQATNMNWAATSEGYQKTLNAAMDDCLRQMIPDVARTIRAEVKASGQGQVSCPNCHAPNLSGTAFCGGCGKKLGN